MRLYQQLVLFMLAATVLPLALLGFWLLRNAEHELSESLGREQRALASSSAETAGNALISAVDRLVRATELVDWERATADETRGALSLVFQQVPGSNAVVLVGADGKPRAEPVFLKDAQEGHGAFSPEALPRVLEAVPVTTLREGGRGQAALSGAYPAGDDAAIAVAVKVADGPGAPFVIVELSLVPLREALLRKSGAAATRVELVDGGGRVLTSTAAVPPLTPLEASLWAEVKRALQTQSLSLRTLQSPRLLVSVSPLPERLGLFTLVSVPESVALAPVRDMRRTVLVSMGAALCGLLLLGLAFTRRMNTRLTAVVQGAEAFSRGELSVRIPEQGADELSELSRTFNRMGGELESARARLLTWNDELKARVDEATKELREAQDQLLEAQKLAAVGQLGAGVAHEINNPLAGILGNTQLLLMDRSAADPDFRSLQKIEECAKRCKEITQSLLRFSERRERPELRPVDLNGVVRDAVSLSSNQAVQEGTTFEVSLAEEPLMVHADPSHLAQVVLALVANARTATMKTARKVIRVTSRAVGDEVSFQVVDTGKGIPSENLQRIFEPFFTTKDVWSNVGLGLSVAYRVVTEHRGQLEVTSEVGQGTVVTVRLPRWEEGRSGSTLQSASLGGPAAPAAAVGGQGSGIRG